MWCHLHDVLDKEKLLYGEKSLNIANFGDLGIGKKRGKIFWDDGNAPYADWDLGYVGVQICHNSSYETLKT